ncbi:hypothetical protein [Rhizosphaericola mali]|uniref:hypothetical protein n=1 Tax=Rhizosphaericola mali TaxID=2545455 RepID=UPI00177FC553|nr:hypothetical protein [Rhizosphaericola mali]
MVGTGFSIGFWDMDSFSPKWIKHLIAYEVTTIGIYYYYLYKQKKAQREEEFWDE